MATNITGQAIITDTGLQKLINASQGTSTTLNVTTFSVSDYNGLTNIESAKSWTSLPSYIWLSNKNISKVNNPSPDTFEITLEVEATESIGTGRVFGIFLDDGTLFMVAKPPYDFPAGLKQTLRVQLNYNNVRDLVVFQYLSVDEIEQDYNILGHQAYTTKFISDNQDEIALLKNALIGLEKRKDDLIKLVQSLEDSLLKTKNDILNLENANSIEHGLLSNSITQNTVSISDIYNQINSLNLEISGIKNRLNNVEFEVKKHEFVIGGGIAVSNHYPAGQGVLLRPLFVSPTFELGNNDDIVIDEVILALNNENTTDYDGVVFDIVFKLYNKFNSIIKQETYQVTAPNTAASDGTKYLRWSKVNWVFYTNLGGYSDGYYLHIDIGMNADPPSGYRDPRYGDYFKIKYIIGG